MNSSASHVSAPLLGTNASRDSEMHINLSCALQWAFFCSLAWSFSVLSGQLTLNKDKHFSIETLSADLQKVNIESLKDTISLSTQILGVKQPHQLLYILSNDAGLDFPLFPKFIKGQATSQIVVAKIPEALRAEDSIKVSIIAADSSEKEGNVYQQLFELVISDDVKSRTEYQAPKRLGAVPEIHHMFKTEAATVNAIIPVVFSACAIVLFVLLIGTWMSVLNGKLFGAKEGGTWKVGFLSVVAYLEVTFAKYYLEALIFATLFQVFILIGPFLFFSSRALTSLRRQRADGKA